MRPSPSFPLFIIVALALVAAPAAAQIHTTAAGYGIGFIRPGALNPGVAGDEASLDAGWVATIFGETWHVLDGRLGTRLNAGYTHRPLQIDGDARDINTWMVDANLMLRVMEPDELNTVAPFLSLGGGIVHYGLGTGAPIVYPEAGVEYPGDNQVQWALVGGAGLDIMPTGFRLGSTPLGIRVEVADHVVFRSPFLGEGDERLGPIHNLRAGISLIGFGWF